MDIILTLAAFTQFSAVLDPQEADAGKVVKVIVKNEGNTSQTFSLACVSQGNQLEFEYLEPERPSHVAEPAGPVPSSQPGGVAPVAQPADDTLILIPPGETAAFRFTARQRSRPLMGSPAPYPYQAVVKADHKDRPPCLVRSMGMD